MKTPPGTDRMVRAVEELPDYDALARRRPRLAAFAPTGSIGRSEPQPDVDAIR